MDNLDIEADKIYKDLINLNLKMDDYVFLATLLVSYTKKLKQYKGHQKKYIVLKVLKKCADLIEDEENKKMYLFSVENFAPSVIDIIAKPSKVKVLFKKLKLLFCGLKEKEKKENKKEKKENKKEPQDKTDKPQEPQEPQDKNKPQELLEPQEPQESSKE